MTLQNDDFDPVLLRRLEDLLDARAGGYSNAEKFPFATGVMIVQKLFRIGGPSSSDPDTVLFREDLTQRQKQFVCAYFTRLAVARPETQTVEPDFLARLTQLIAQVAPREVYAGLNAKAQTHERWRCVNNLLANTERDLAAVIASFRDLSSFGVFRQNYLQRFRPKAAQFIIAPFLPTHIAVDIRLNELFNLVEAYIHETTADKSQRFTKVRQGLEDLGRDANNIGTRYATDYVGKVAMRLAELIRNDYESGPYAKPGEVEILPTEKRYPLREVNARFNVSFVLRNKGPGLVSDLEFELLDISGLELATPKIYLGELPPGDRVVELAAIVKTSQEDALTGCGRVSWRQFDGMRRTEDFIVPVSIQRFALDWAHLSRQDPYALEPVSNEANLIGRKMLLDQLLAQTRSPSVVSSLVIGQKRVGKTSIVRTFEASGTKELSNTSFIYVESGDYINPDPARTVADLGRCLCSAILVKHKSLEGLPVPPFDNSLTPLAPFLAEVSRRLPDQKLVFILDEFDELPLSLYKHSQVGDAMFLTIRSISGKPPYGFVLVGSEKLNTILSFQGEKLNKFSQLNVDYFDREKEWISYCELVRKPVAGWFEIDDTAIVCIYKETAGNPFFTKLVCRELFKLMVARHDAHVTEGEMQEAVSAAINSASSVNFQHFWDDGIFETGERKEHISLQRRKMLMAFADCVRTDDSVGKNILQGVADSYGVDAVAFEEYLREFVSRGIWILEGGFVFCKVPLFSKWLRLSGVKTIISTVVDAEAAISKRRQNESYRIASAELVETCRRFGMYKGMAITEDRVRAWVEQFGPDLRAQRVMFRLLQNVRFYSAAAIRAKMRDLHRRVAGDDMVGGSNRRRTDVLISYIDGPGKSGTHYARLYADVNHLHMGCIVEPKDIAERLRAGAISTLLFIDDLVATGETAVRGLRRILQEVSGEIQTVGIPVILAAICVFDRARANVEIVGKEFECDFTLLVGDILLDSDRAFHQSSSLFDNEADREFARGLAYDKGRDLEPRCPLGYGDCEALIAFESSCPNNTLPVLWSQHKDWLALFPRS